MAVLTDQQRKDARHDYWQELSRLRESLAIDKVDGLAAVAAVDQWINDAQAEYNAALPLPFRTEATVSQKARLLMTVIAFRFNIGVV